jgi:hypothetical protein
MGAQASTQITNRLTRDHRLYFRARERAVIVDMVPDIRALVQNGPVPEVAIVELGAGDANERHGNARMRRDIRRVLELLRPVPCVRWLSLKIAGVNGFYQGYVARADDFNRILTRQLQIYHRRSPAPYRQWANAHPGAFKADGLHHTERGKALYSAFIESVADNCPP